MKETKITYLYHSGFSVETPRHFLIFDYYKHDKSITEGGLSKGYISIDDLPRDKEIFVFVSHSHRDHFNSIIFQWSKVRRVTYILSYDIPLNHGKSTICHFMRPGDTAKIGNTNIQAFGSTDKGVSFLVSVDNLRIFHSGDLNWWHWKDSTLEEQLQEELDFKRELAPLLNESIDITFVPVDPRLEEFAFLAAVYLAEKIKPRLIIPMHFAEDTTITELLPEKISSFSTRAAIIKKQGEIISYSSI